MRMYPAAVHAAEVCGRRSRLPHPCAGKKRHFLPLQAKKNACFKNEMTKRKIEAPIPEAGDGASAGDEMGIAVSFILRTPHPEFTLLLL